MAATTGTTNQAPTLAPFIWWNAFSGPGMATGWHYTEQRKDAPIHGPFATRGEAEQHAKDNAK